MLMDGVQFADRLLEQWQEFREFLPEAWGQFVRFWTLRDPAVRTALAGTLCLSVSCGTLGCFVVLRRLSLMGDSLGHAVLPGVCLGFLVTRTKDMRWIALGALISALLGSGLISLINRRSKLKTDTAMGLVLSGFFGLGVVLLTRLQNFPYGNQSGLNQFLFGQASAISERDLWFIAPLSAGIVGMIVLAFKELTLTSFDEAYATAIGLPSRSIHYLLMGLVSLAIVIAIQAVGVVLLSAMLVTPAATARLLTDRLRTMLVLSAVCGAVSAVIGLNLSFLGRSLPTGPFIVLALSLMFVSAYLFSPRHGLLLKSLRRHRQAVQTQRENLLKSIYLAQLESQAADTSSQQQPANGPFSPMELDRLAAFCNEPPGKLRKQLAPLASRDWIVLSNNTVSLTRTGETRAAELVRNYRLWEQFLTQEVNLPFDHTQRDAEQIEHILGPDLVRELESQLSQDADRPPAPN